MINASVFLLAFTYLMTCISAILLQKKHQEVASNLRWKLLIPLMGALFSVALVLFVDPSETLVSLALMAVGVPIFILFSPGEELPEVKRKRFSEEASLRQACCQGLVFLAYPLNKLKLFVYRRNKQTSALICDNKEPCGETESCKPI